MAQKKKKQRKAARRTSTQSRGKSRARAAGLWFERLVRLQARLRAPNGCPWDVEQTHLTLRTYLIEEAYEVLEALESGDDEKFAEELGDLLLQVVFHAQIATEAKTKLLILTHILFFGASEERVLAEARSRFSGNVVLPHDLQVF